MWIEHAPVAGFHVRVHDAARAPEQVRANGDGRVGGVKDEHVRGVVGAHDGADACLDLDVVGAQTLHSLREQITRITARRESTSAAIPPLWDVR